MGFIQKFIPLALIYPAYLLLLAALVPTVVLMSRRSLAGLGRGRRFAAVVARSLLVTLLILILCGAQRVKVVDDRVVLFMLDKSKSIPNDQQAMAFQFVKESAAAMRPGKDRMAVLAFDGRTSIEQLPTDGVRIDGISPGIDPNETDIAAAMRMAAALVPGDQSARIVVLSDGNETIGSAEHEAQTLAALKLPVDIVPLEYEHTNEVVLERLDAPASARINETISLGLVFRARQFVSGRVRIRHGDQELNDDTGKPGFPVTLQPGVNRMTLPVKISSEGIHRFSAVIEPDDLASDVIAQNNRGEAFTRVGGKDRVLIIGNDDSDEKGTEFRSMQVIAEALAAQAIEADVTDAKHTRLNSATLFPYAAVILSNVSAVDIGDDGPEALASYARDLGGGLIVLGGDQSFSVGGYFNTALEDVLPVETNRRKLVTLNLGLILVIDRSGSMAGTKLVLAKQAAAASAKLLSSSDRIGVIAFDTMYDWAVPLRLCNNKQAILNHIQTIGIGGGTSMYPAMCAAINALANSPVSLKHIILLTDGQSLPGDFDGAAADAITKNITISTIAIGADCDFALLSGIAKTANGRSYRAVDGNPLPRIFARETIIAGRSSLQEKRFVPTVRPSLDDLYLKAMVSEGLPPLDGYVVTIPKPSASVLLTSRTDQGEDPILAHWQVGLGRTLAFTSGMWPKWGSEWIKWPAFSQFWSQIVRWASRSFGRQDAMVWTRVEGRKAAISVELEERNEMDSMPAALTAQVVDPNFKVTPVLLKPVGPGRYEAEFETSAAGSYIVNVFQQGRELSSLVRAGVTVAYSPEFAEVRSNTGLLRSVAETTGGRVLSTDDPKKTFDVSAFTEFRTPRPIERELFIATIALLIFDVAVRRIAIRREAVAEWFAARFGRTRVIAAEAQQLTMSALRDARGRARTDRIPEDEHIPSNAVNLTPRIPSRTSQSAESAGPPITVPRELPKRFKAPTVPPIDLKAGSVAPASDAPKSSEKAASQGNEPGQSTTARLLSIKRKRQS
ncbi:MAG: VWA domain-containing protein [Phycisphaerae bacterium]|nr:VWA domain-containing protein [Phycisphaerae bacterium]